MLFKTEKIEQLDLDTLMDGMLKGELLQEQLGVSDELLDKCYKIGCRYLDDRKFEEAADIFVVLVSINAYVPEFWMRLGNAESGKREYDDALQAYFMAILYDADDPFPHVYAAEVYLHLKKFDEAIECLTAAKQLTEQDGNLKNLEPLIDKLTAAAKAGRRK